MSTHQQPPSQPEIPAELWMLWIPDMQRWVLSVDDAPTGPTYLVAFSEADALVASRYQEELYDFESIPVRVK